MSHLFDTLRPSRELKLAAVSVVLMVVPSLVVILIQLTTVIIFNRLLLHGCSSNLIKYLEESLLRGIAFHRLNKFVGILADSLTIKDVIMK